MKRSSAMQRLGLVFVLAMLGLLGCGESEPAAAPAPPAATPPAPTAEAPAPAPAAAPVPAQGLGKDVAASEAKQIFSSRCMTCHGPEGAGDGPASMGLSPAPRNFQDMAWQASVTDDYIEKIIKVGGAAVGKSPVMPPNPDLVAKPEVVTALREYVRSLRR